MICPACSGKGYRDLRIGPTEGLCPKCGGAGSIKEERDEGSWLFDYVPCKDCSGTGIKPTSNGGTREGLNDTVMASGGLGGMGGRQTSDTDVEVEEDTEPQEPEDDRGFFSRYRWYFIGGGVALLVVLFVASQTSKKK